MKSSSQRHLPPRSALDRGLVEASPTELCLRERMERRLLLDSHSAKPRFCGTAVLETQLPLLVHG